MTIAITPKLHTRFLDVCHKASIPILDVTTATIDCARIGSLTVLNPDSLTNLPCTCTAFDTLTVSSLDILDTTNLTNLPCSCTAFDTLIVSSLDILDTTNLTNLPCTVTAFDTLTTSALDVPDGATIGCSLSVGCTITLPDSVDQAHGNIIKNNALFLHTYPSLTTANLFLGSNAGSTTATGQYNTALGTAAMSTITSGFANTALGSGALMNITQGLYNSAAGNDALQALSSGNYNTAIGTFALQAATTASSNTAISMMALSNLLTGTTNTALGDRAGMNITTGRQNIAIGFYSLGNPTTPIAMSGIQNIVISNALTTNIPNGQPAVGFNITTGQNNIIIGNTVSGIPPGNMAPTNQGENAGNLSRSDNLIAGSNNIYISKPNSILDDESGAIRIGDTLHGHIYVAGIYGALASGGLDVVVTFDGHLGVPVSSSRFKDNITDLGHRAAHLGDLRPVQFTYRNADGNTTYGLIAEDVAAIYPELVVYDKDGAPLSIRYKGFVPLLLHAHQQYYARAEDIQERTHNLVHRLTTNHASKHALEKLITHLIERISHLEAVPS